MNFKDDLTYNLEWQKVPDAEFYTLDIADNEAFAGSIQNKVIDTHFEFRPQSGGNYYFKVKAGTSKGVESSTSPVVQLALTYPAIQLNNKLLQATYTAKSSKDEGLKKKFDVSWSPVAAADKYVVEIDKDPKFSKPISSISRKPSSVISVPQTGNFLYRVSAYDKTGRKISSTATPGEIDYRKVFNMAKPTVDTSVKNMSYYFQRNFAQFIWLKWTSTSTDDRKSYRLEIAKNSSFTEVISAFKTKDPKYLIRSKLDEGEYFWRVRSENESQFSDWSDSGYFKIITKK
jgi:hypothetical protein